MTHSLTRLCASAVFLLALSLAPSVAAYEIGHTTLTLYDPARGNRVIPTEIYYPADVAGEDVPVATAVERFPVIAFGHGYLMSWSLYDYVHQGLVPAGYIVTYPDTEDELFPDHEDLGLDIAFVIQSMRDAGVDPGSPFHGRVASTAAAMGHSMGGGASLLAAASDQSITALANLAAAETNPSAVAAAAGITVPALLFLGGNDCVAPPAGHQIPMYDALASGCRTRVTIDGASHCQFAESSWVCELGEGGCDDPTVSRAEQQSAVMTLLLPWLDYTLKNDVLAWLDFEELLNTAQGIAYEQSCEPTDVAEAAAPMSRLTLSPSFPNPTTGKASLLFHLTEPAQSSIRIYSPAGRLVAEVARGPLTEGWHAVSWDGRTRTGHVAAGGVYCWRIDAGGESADRAIVVVR